MDTGGFRDASVILVDLGDDNHDVMVSNGGWRDTVAVLRPFGVLDEKRLQRLETYWLGQELTEQEARAVGDALIAGPLAAVNWSGDVYPPTGFWTDPEGNPQDYDLATYWPRTGHVLAIVAAGVRRLLPHMSRVRLLLKAND